MRRWEFLPWVEWPSKSGGVLPCLCPRQAGFTSNSVCSLWNIMVLERTTGSLAKVGLSALLLWPHHHGLLTASPIFWGHIAFIPQSHCLSLLQARSGKSWLPNTKRGAGSHRQGPHSGTDLSSSPQRLLKSGLEWGPSLDLKCLHCNIVSLPSSFSSGAEDLISSIRQCWKGCASGRKATYYQRN